MKTIALSLFSGGLDSLIAVRLISDQGIHVEGVTFETPFFSASKARTSASRVKLPLTVLNFTEEHLVMLKNPRYGYGKNMNPCIDCHTLMLKKTGDLMAEMGADFIFTGEVLGQRPMSQGKQSLYVVAKNSGYADVILRPLSAKLLPETKPEREGKVDRQRLLDIQGRGRKTQMELASRYGIADYPPPAGGCLLTDPMFSNRLRDLFRHQKDPPVTDMELLKYGRHFRTDRGIKIIVGRNSSDNEGIEHWRQEEDGLLYMLDVPGPSVLVPGGGDADSISLAAGLCALYGGSPPDADAHVVSIQNRVETILTVRPVDKEMAARLIIQ
ncbi:MAG: tRNA 4-thiouridine(8) synthase ThiI [Syntrophales bacterium]|nr:tRNA 4-thiouridine(8) synthase ThiI [Syntrophales bacterium]